MAISGPGDFHLERTLKIGVRPPQLPILERTAKRLAPGESLTLGSAALERFVPHEPLRAVHECVFGVLALESEPVDPRL